MTFEDIPCQECFESLRKYVSNPSEKSQGYLDITFEDIPYTKCFKCFKSSKEYASNPLEKSPGHLEMTFECIPY